jgi:STE24 endopeptidase
LSRILILIPFLVWLSWTDNPSAASLLRYTHSPALVGILISPMAPLLFFGFYAVMILALGCWARWLARRVAANNFLRTLKRFNRMAFAARLIIPAWFTVGTFFLGWATLVHRYLGDTLSDALPGVIIGTLPAFVAWIGLWWAQYPADRALREQSILNYLEVGLPIHAPPRLGKYILSNLRLQVLFMAAPVLLWVGLHDLGSLLLAPVNLSDAARDNADLAIWLGAGALVFLFSPEILRRVLHTQPLGDSPLRRRLEALCQRHGVRCRDVLLWRTDFAVGNAAVMGFIPQMRYILLSDLLLETMTDAQIEAVFAHEIAHIVHRHMNWYLVFIVALALFSEWADRGIVSDGPNSPIAPYKELVYVASFLVKFLILFGFVSRRFERQADVFAARAIQASASRGDAQPAPLPPVIASPISSLNPASNVGEYGATLFGSALHRVAAVNNIPVAARSWCHGSIGTRMKYLRRLSDDPQRTQKFDALMRWLYLALLVALAGSGALFMMTMY